MEFLVFLLTLASLLTLEFLPSTRKPILFAALSLSLLTFSVLAVGENVTGQNEGVASLFLYAAGTGVFMILLRYLPPFSVGPSGTASSGSSPRVVYSIKKLITTLKTNHAGLTQPGAVHSRSNKSQETRVRP
jgi:hypothetical protein